MRLFVGIPVAPAVAGELAATCESLARRATSQQVPLRWLAPATYHVTLKYLGWTRPEVVPAVHEAIVRATAGHQPFRFRAARLGAFARPAKATVVWAGVDDPGALGALAEALDRELSALGFPREQRSFHPHVTLGRLREPADVGGVLLPFSEQVFSETRVEFATLFESLTKPTGSEYRVVLREALGGPKKRPDRQSDPVEPTPFDASAGTEDGWDRHQG
ncbi:MAG TPA: RNA 2',3'-cyclic phosphodiesterase [Kofleriaceae bacterium]|jgi:2'-5' RNA ligase|nr:RNA 2',3'-cyclic phosphodiesterase [Kofleriaceae bacterium]